jgi:hypothetical protein
MIALGRSDSSIKLVAFSFALCASLLAGCGDGGHELPLYSAQSVVGRFGYAERQIEPARWQIVYLTPDRPTYNRPGTDDRRAEEALLKREAHDMALWRAAAIALDHGFKGFTALDSESATGSRHFVHDVGSDPWPRSEIGGAFGFGGKQWGSPLPLDLSGFGWSDAGYLIQVQETLSVTFSDGPAEGWVAAEPEIARLRAAYPGAEGAIPALE